MLLKVATQNPVKVAAIKAAFERIFKEEVMIAQCNVTSGVPEQPLNDEVFGGAKNRLNQLVNLGLSEASYDYFVACEGGLVNLYGTWFNIQVVMVQDKKGKMGSGISQGYQVPKEHIKEAIQTSVAEVLDSLYGGKGGIRVLSKDQFTREKLIEDATVMALTKIINGENW